VAAVAGRAMAGRSRSGRSGGQGDDDDGRGGAPGRRSARPCVASRPSLSGSAAARAGACFCLGPGPELLSGARPCLSVSMTLVSEQTRCARPLSLGWGTVSDGALSAQGGAMTSSDWSI